jgi:DNA-binding Xre family transcriptional regulator
MKIKTLRLKSLAVEKGYTFTDLAIASGVSRNTVSSIYNGKNCSLATAAKLSKALGVSLEDIAEE